MTWNKTKKIQKNSWLNNLLWCLHEYHKLFHSFQQNDMSIHQHLHAIHEIDHDFWWIFVLMFLSLISMCSGMPFRVRARFPLFLFSSLLLLHVSDRVLVSFLFLFVWCCCHRRWRFFCDDFLVFVTFRLSFLDVCVFVLTLLEMCAYVYGLVWNYANTFFSTVVLSFVYFSLLLFYFIIFAVSFPLFGSCLHQIGRLNSLMQPNRLRFA